MKYQHCALLPFSLILIVAGLVTLLLFGIGNLEPYTHTKDFRTATCTVVLSNLSGEVPCKHLDAGDTDKTLHRSMYPCLLIIVNYTEHLTQYDILDYEDEDEQLDVVDDLELVTQTDLNITDMNTTGAHTIPVAPQKSEYNRATKDEGLISVENVLLYDTYESWTMQRQGEANSTCSVHVCQQDESDNQDDVNEFLDDYGTVGYSFRCYFNPRNTKEVFADVVSGNSVMHALVWPALAIGFGVFLLVVVAFLSCEVWICRNPKRAQRRMQGQTYQLASYRDNTRPDPSRHGWRSNSRDPEAEAHNNEQSKRRPGDGNNNSRLPNLSAAADIIRKWSYRTRSDRTSSSSQKESDTNRSSRSYAGNPSRQWSIGKADRSFPTT